MPAPTKPAPSYSKCYALKEIIYGFWATKVTYTPDKYPDLTGKTAVVTGCNTGVGKEAAKLLYQKNCNVIGVCRTESKGLEAAESIKQEIGNSKGSISVVSGCDFLDFTTVPQAGKRIQEILAGKPLNIIIHNAGLMSSSNTGTSKQGLEAMFQTNVMGPQLLQHYLDPVFLKEDDTSLKRIVWVSSGAHLLGPSQYGIFWENPGFDGVAIEKRPAATTLYGATKAANILQAKAWATRNKEMVDKIGCVSVSCYPGNLRTDLQRDWHPWTRATVGRLFYPAEYGAYTELYSVLSPSLTTSDQGKYICPFDQVHEPRDDVKEGLQNGTDLALWDWIESEIKEYIS
ncbi:short chain dehydrogenase [Nakaseomyces glabratus]|nr:short chain dehydrogenase [Nakaseomyces glabratus]KAH7585298.1 short chain dehydrogenase [Nakaseomyces glabratus]